MREEVSPVTEAIVEEQPGDEPEEPSQAMPASDGTAKDLLSVEEAVQRIPESLRKEMKELLKAEFHQVQRWKPGQPV